MVSIASVPWTGWSRVQIVVGTKIFSLLQIDQSTSATNPAFYLMGPGVPSWDLRCQNIKLMTDPYLVLRLVWSYASTPPICLHDVGVVTRYGLHGLGIESQCGQ